MHTCLQAPGARVWRMHVIIVAYARYGPPAKHAKLCFQGECGAAPPLKTTALSMPFWKSSAAAATAPCAAQRAGEGQACSSHEF